MERDPLAAYLAPTHLGWLADEPETRWRELDCSLLFADVSGFTSLSERLGRRGQIGAEQLTDAVNAIFAAMLAQVERGAGELLKFGGDAILVLFQGDEHARRACAVALGIQDQLAGLRVLPGRRAQLSVSAGVASGLGHLFLAGDAPRELIVAGPLASQVVEMEGLAEAGEVIISPGTRQELGDGSVGEARGGGRMLLDVALNDALEPVVARTGIDPRPGLPAHLHDHRAGHGEHRTIGVGFVQFSGSDALLADRGPVALAVELNDLFAATARACRDWGVTLVSTDADRDAGKIVLCAGAPTASPDDTDRLLHALRAIVGTPVALSLRAGANRGQAFTVDIGPERRRFWSVMGDTVNLAARIMGRAGEGQVVASVATLERVRDSFERARLEPFSVKGKSEPVHAEIVGPARGTGQARAPHETPFVGRREELGALREAVAFAGSGGRRIVELTGEPGIGKSRLVAALLDADVGMPVIRVQAGPYGAHSPYLALREPLRALLGCPPDASDSEAAALLTALVEARAEEVLPWLPLLGIPLGLELDPTPQTASLAPEFARQRLNAAFAHLLDLVLPETPVLTVVEDAHWLDEASSDLLLHLFTADRTTGPRVGWGASTADRAAAVAEGGAGLAAIVTRRAVPEGLSLEGAPGVVKLPLQPLGFDDARLLVLGGGLDAALPTDTRRELLERAEGNPLLLGELIAAVRAGHSLDELPDTVEALMTARIDTLPRDDRLLVREASVLGVLVLIPLLAELVGRDRVALNLALAGLGEFLRPEGPDASRFRHELLRRSAYGALSFRRRRELHARAAEAIEAEAGEEAESHSELLAIHFHAAGRWAESWHYARLAGERAVRRAAPVEAAGFFTGALEAARHLRRLDPAQVAAVAEALGDATELAGDYAEAAKAFSKARKLAAADPLVEAGLCLRQGQVAESSRHLSAALRWFTRGLKTVEGGKPGRARESLRAQLTLAHGATRLRAGRLRECLPYLDEAVALAKRSRDRATEAHAYYLLDWAHTDLGLPGAERYRDLALPIFEQLDDHARQGRVLNNLGVNAYYEGQWEQAVDFYERSRDASEKAGDFVEGRGTALNNIAEIRIDQGLIDDAEDLLRDALGTWRAARYRTGVGTALKNLGRIATRRGNYERAAELLAQARAEFEAVGSESLIAEADAWEAERLVSASEPEAALKLLERLKQSVGRVDVTPAIRAAIERLGGQAARGAGDADAAAEAFIRSAELAREAGADYDQALATLALAQLGELGEGTPEASELRSAEREAREALGRLGVVAEPPLAGFSRS